MKLFRQFKHLALALLLSPAVSAMDIEPSVPQAMHQELSFESIRKSYQEYESAPEELRLSLKAKLISAIYAILPNLTSAEINEAIEISKKLNARSLMTRLQATAQELEAGSAGDSEGDKDFKQIPKEVRQIIFDYALQSYGRLDMKQLRSMLNTSKFFNKAMMDYRLEVRLWKGDFESGTIYAIAAVFPNIKAIKLDSRDATDENLKAISEVFPNIEKLDLSFKFGDHDYHPQIGYTLEGFRHILNLKSLKSLKLKYNESSSEIIQELANSECASHLVFLGLGGNKIDDNKLEILLKSEKLKKLEHLDLSENTITDKGIGLLAAAESLPLLKGLDLHNNKITTLKPLAETTHYPGLTYLNLEHNQVKDEGLAALQDSLNFKSLETLILADNSVSGVGVSSIASCPSFTKMMTLILAQNRIGPQGMKALAESPYIKNLKHLDVKLNGIGSEGMRYFSSSANFGGIEILNLEDNNIDESAVLLLVESLKYPHLKMLNLRRNLIHMKGQAAVALVTSENLPSLMALDLETFEEGYRSNDKDRAALKSQSRNPDVDLQWNHRYWKY